jgi:Arc/MetJ-type ribon-helix-helix transcriptional regulator
MSNRTETIELPDDLRAFAEERVRAGQNASVNDVIREALEDKKRAALNEALDVGLAELDAGLGTRSSPEKLMAEIQAELGMKRHA